MKRLLDFVVALVALVLLSPVLVALALAVKLDSPGPIIFTQERVGRYRRPFKMYKFRTMRSDAPHDVPTHLLAGAHNHVTSMGRVLRKLSLDELPQLVNILKGEMSFVGPRPALWNQSDLVAERDKYGANDVRPGLTGWAQINGRDELEIAEKASVDGYYVQHRSLWLDLMCVLGTVLPVVRGAGVVEGASSAGGSTVNSASEDHDADQVPKVGCES